MPATDAVLVRRARGGDRDAFAALVRRHRPLLLRSCARMVGEEAAADAAQDAVITAMLSLDRLREPSSFGAWLVGIGLNACRAMLRARRDVVARDDVVTEPHDIVVARELAARVRVAIAALPRGQREAVTLYYLA